MNVKLLSMVLVAFLVTPIFLTAQPQQSVDNNIAHVLKQGKNNLENVYNQAVNRDDKQIKSFNPLNIEDDWMHKTDTPPPSSGTWSISDVTTIENEIIIVNGSIQINSGGKLVLKNSIIYMNSQYDGQYSISVLSGGNLTILNSTITAYNPGIAYYIKVSDGAYFYMNGGEISYAGYRYTDRSGLYINQDNTVIKNSILRNNYIGIYVKANNVSLINVTVENSERDGVFISSGSNVKLENCYISNNGGAGLYNYGGSNLTLTNSVFINDGVTVIDTYNNYFENNTVNGMPLVYLEQANNVVVENAGQVIVVNSTGILVRNVDISKTDSGVLIVDSSNITIKNSHLRENDICIRTYKSSDIKIENNWIENCPSGVHVNTGNSFVVTDNIFIDSGLFFYDSYGNTVTNNTVNGMPLVYLEQANNVVVENAGQAIIINSTNIIVRDAYVKNVYTGIEIYESDNVTVMDSEIYNVTRFGVYAYSSTQIQIIKNSFKANEYAIDLYRSNTGTIKLNDIRDNENGLVLSSSTGILVYLNNFISNKHVYDNQANQFNNTSFGNYWDNYNGVDTNGDFIGETNYTLDADTVDCLPLVVPVRNWNWEIFYLIAHWKTTEGTTYIRAKIIDGNVEGLVYFWYRIGNITLFTRAQYDPIMDAYFAIVQSGDVEEARLVISTTYLAPKITDVSWTPTTPVESEKVKVYANVTDELGVSKVILSYYINGWSNVTMAYNSSLKLWEGEIPPASVGTTVHFRIYANNTYDVWAVSEEYTYTVSPSDKVGPKINEILWIPEKPTNRDTVLVRVNVSDGSGVKNVILSYFIGAWFNVTMVYNSTTGYWEAKIPAASPGTEVKLKIYAEDTYGNWSLSQEYTYTVTGFTPSNPMALYGMAAVLVIIVAIVAVFIAKKRGFF
ncbi:MAG: right-handed parallel beta-helix repeat-containing protein [Candidatus Njordarchaeia archaeon]